MTSIGRATRLGGLKKSRQDEFADWLHKRVLTNRACKNNIHKIGLKLEKEQCAMMDARSMDFHFTPNLMRNIDQEIIVEFV